MTIGHLTLFSALFISSVAIYFSVAGLAAIFSAYATSIYIMGGAIELGKLAAVIWLHQNWNTVTRTLKYGMIVAIIAIMILTSIGIYGWLSKSHIEQTNAAKENIAKIEIITKEITRTNATIAKAESKIEQLRTGGSSVDSALQMQIDKEQSRIDSAYERVKPEIVRLEQKIIKSELIRDKRTLQYDNEIASINNRLNELQAALNSGDIKKAQRIAGTKPDGIYKSKTVKAIDMFRQSNESRRATLLDKVDMIRSEPSASMINTQAELVRIRDRVQSEIAISRLLIDRLQGKIGTSAKSDVETLLLIEKATIKTSSKYLDDATEIKAKLESSFRTLEADVGPILYIAAFIYGGEPDRQLLEQAVRWIILLIILVFDPLAVLLLIAAQHSFDQARKRKEEVDRKPLPHSILPQYRLDGILPALKANEDILTEGATLHAKKKKTNLKPTGPPPRPTPPENVNENDIYIEEIEHEIDEVIAQQMTVTIIKVGEEHINYNGKVYQKEALFQTFPDLLLDLSSPVAFGKELMKSPLDGNLMIKTDTVPTQLFRFNGNHWDHIDKNLLELSAYSDAYIQSLIGAIGAGDYNTELLNIAEKHHIERLYSR